MIMDLPKYAPSLKNCIGSGFSEIIFCSLLERDVG
jgi:hypothetical protein